MGSFALSGDLKQPCSRSKFYRFARDIDIPVYYMMKAMVYDNW